ncbi:hypothetical protein [Actinobacillus equuli]|uniref:hypothetical protein n=1 Tax=Actinobacillus equuli TaxID=718 RepID=UPI0024427017|nr:hypothetical protein [Actinobacillus equuli]WGE57918.1 hypothetical protein NYR71_03940 [Actinobacillus equuli subsp. equuli]
MKKNSSLNSITQAIKFALACVGGLISQDTEQSPLFLHSVEHIAMPSDSASKMQKAFASSIAGFTSMVESMRKDNIPILLAHSISSKEIEDFHADILELQGLIGAVEQQTSSSDFRNIVKKLRKFNHQLELLYQDIATHAYKQEADQVILSRAINIETAHSFDSSHSRDDIYRALLG